MLEGKWLHVITNVEPMPGASHPRIWFEEFILVSKYRHWQPGLGKTGKGLLHFRSNVGGYRCVDVEDICDILLAPPKRKK